MKKIYLLTLIAIALSSCDKNYNMPNEYVPTSEEIAEADRLKREKEEKERNAILLKHKDYILLSKEGNSINPLELKTQADKDKIFCIFDKKTKLAWFYPDANKNTKALQIKKANILLKDISSYNFEKPYESDLEKFCFLNNKNNCSYISEINKLKDIMLCGTNEWRIPLSNEIYLLQNEFFKLFFTFKKNNKYWLGDIENMTNNKNYRITIDILRNKEYRNLKGYEINNLIMVSKLEKN